MVKQENSLAVAAVSQRADALDALRGLAVLAMVLSGTIARKTLPAWMYSDSQINEVYRNPVLSSFPGQNSYLTFLKKAIKV